MVYQLIYSSSARGGFTEADARKIAQTSAARNAARDITGILLYLDGTILQVLEGDELDVENLYALIELDTRHAGVTRLLSRKTEKRDFEKWSMGFSKVTPEAASAALFKLTQNALDREMPADKTTPVATLIRVFASAA